MCCTLSKVLPKATNDVNDNEFANSEANCPVCTVSISDGGSFIARKQTLNPRNWLIGVNLADINEEKYEAKVWQGFKDLPRSQIKTFKGEEGLVSHEYIFGKKCNIVAVKACDGKIIEYDEE